MNKCIVINCNKLGTHKGYCFKHYLKTKQTIYYKLKHPKIEQNIWTMSLQEQLEKLLNLIIENQNQTVMQEKELCKLKQIRKYQNKYYRGLNFICLFPNPFSSKVEIEWHHITNTYVVAIPKDLHKMYNRPSRKKHRELLISIVNQIYSKPQEQKALNSLSASILMK